MMNFGTYLFNMDDEDFAEVRQLVEVSKTLDDDNELKRRIQALREIFAVCDEGGKDDKNQR